MQLVRVCSLSAGTANLRHEERALERLFGEPIAVLLAPPKATVSDGEGPAAELRQLLDTARRVDRSTITLLHQQLDAIRRLDRQLGAIVVRDELNAKSGRSSTSPHTASLPAPGNHSPRFSPKCTPSPDGKHSTSVM